MQVISQKGFCSFALDSAHEKFDVWTKEYLSNYSTLIMRRVFGSSAQRSASSPRLIKSVKSLSHPSSPRAKRTIFFYLIISLYSLARADKSVDFSPFNPLFMFIHHPIFAFNTVIRSAQQASLLRALHNICRPPTADAIFHMHNRNRETDCLLVI